MGNNLVHQAFNRIVTFLVTTIAFSLPASTILRYINVAAKSIVTEGIPDEKIRFMVRHMVLFLSTLLMSTSFGLEYVMDDFSGKYILLAPMPFFVLALLVNIILRLLIFMEQRRLSQDGIPMDKEPKIVAIGILCLSLLAPATLILKYLLGHLNGGTGL